jgi:hypothetical protein
LVTKSDFDLSIFDSGTSQFKVVILGALPFISSQSIFAIVLGLVEEEFIF